MAAAAPVNMPISKFKRDNLPVAQSRMADFLAQYTIDNLRVETFDGHRAWDGVSGSSSPQDTEVGSFTALGRRHGAGNSIINGGRALEVRGDNDMEWGRYNTNILPPSVLGGHYLDSNDKKGMRWDISGVGPFNMVSFFLTDIADVGGKFSIKVGDQKFSEIAGTLKRLRGGNIHLVRILLPETVNDLTIKLKHDRRDDGFSLDGAVIGNAVPIPAPPTALLLISGAVALVGFRRIRARPAA